MGRFADSTITALNETELQEYERLIDAPDPDLFAWVIGDQPVPDEYDTDLFRRLCAFHGANGGMKR
jgi:antitoxin CptB